ncbi:hypothetical protein P5V15_015472 [Pogonomyrmex californicus]
MEGYRNLSEAYNKAILISKRLERDRVRQRDTKSNPVRNISTTDQNRSTIPPISVMQPDRRQPSSPNPSLRVKICAYCKNFGHLISECKKRQYNNAMRDNNQGNLPSPSTSGVNRGGTTRPLYPITTKIPESPSSNSALEPSQPSN